MIATMQTFTRRISFAVLLAAALIFAACDSTNIEPNGETAAGTNTSSVSISFASNVGSAPAKAADAGRITDPAGRVIELESVELVLRDVKFKSPGDNGSNEREVDVGPFLINVPLDSLPEIQIETELPSGIWDQLEMEIDDPTAEDNLDFPEDASIRVSGSWTPLNGPTTEFTFVSDAEGEREIRLAPPLRVGEPDTYNVTLMVHLDRWFRAENGMLVDPATANNDGANESLVENNIEQSFEGFEDNNQDGDDDPSDDRGDDDRSDDDDSRGDDNGDDDNGSDDDNSRGDDNGSDDDSSEDDNSEDRRDDDDSEDDWADNGELGREVDVEGTIGAIGDSTLTVSGRTWVIVEQTRIFREEDEAPVAFAELQVDDYVEVEGIQRSGQLLAKKVKIKQEDGFNDDPFGPEVEVEGRVDALGDSTITVLGQTWEVVPQTRTLTEDEASLAFGELLVDDYVEVEGYERSDGSLVAKKIKLKKEDDSRDGREKVEVKGAIEALTESSITVAGVTFQVVKQTQFGDDDDPLDLSSLEVGDYIEVEGYRNESGEIFASEIEREDDSSGDDDNSSDDSEDDDSRDDDSEDDDN